jgi:hypothetical protein
MGTHHDPEIQLLDKLDLLGVSLCSGTRVISISLLVKNLRRILLVSRILLLSIKSLNILRHLFLVVRCSHGCRMMRRREDGVMISFWGNREIWRYLSQFRLFSPSPHKTPDSSGGDANLGL